MKNETLFCYVCHRHVQSYCDVMMMMEMKIVVDVEKERTPTRKVTRDGVLFPQIGPPICRVV